jgi:hypothetical protein
MDADRFDALSRALSTTHPRRHLTRLLGGVSLGAVLSGGVIREAAAALRNGGYGCTKDDQCKTGKCLGSGKCSCSRKFPRCRQPSNPCQNATCNFSTKRCVTSNRDDGIACGTDQACCNGTCAAATLVGTGSACGSTSECCPGLTCSPDGQTNVRVCCASGKSCNGVCCAADTDSCTLGDLTCCRPANVCEKNCCPDGTVCTTDPVTGNSVCCASENSCNDVCCPRASDVCTIGDLECCPEEKVCGRYCCAVHENCVDGVCKELVIGGS